LEDLKAYIESGVLELYALGELTEDEKAEVESMLAKHPELQLELEDIEKALETYAAAHAVQPPDHLRDRVLGSLDVHSPEEQPSKKEAVVTPINSKPQSNFYKYAFAASVALLLLSLVALINLYSQLKESNNQIALLEQSNQRFSNRVNYVEEQLQDAKQSLNVFHNPETYKLVSLKGTPNAPDARMIVAFSPQKAEVMIDLASIKMPENDPQHQYQLWALVDGKPVDLGVFDAKGDSAKMIKMKSLKEAQAFAVTLEPKGGSINPTMEQMMVMGAI
jgi:anti-sigma-K factor RskA